LGIVSTPDGNLFEGFVLDEPIELHFTGPSVPEASR
jgi:hypothetical protein